ncbi:MAG: ribonuclease III [Rhodospirillaceae bacterium]|nr:ribonuclease III [Rhodospirillaceae bacterium]
MAAELTDILGYKFSNKTLVTEALTHRSRVRTNTGSYERLEFLGDRVLALVIADLLLTEFPSEAEGSLAKRFAELVRRETLAEVAGKAGIASHILLGVSEKERGGRESKTILADVCEALLGAIYLDGGLEPARAFIEQYFLPRIQETMEPPQDAKTALQEWAQSKGYGLPTYRQVLCDGPDHAPVFTISVTVKGISPAQGTGSSKRIAEQAAAKQFLAGQSDD